MKRIVTFGEAMLRLTPGDSARLVQATALDAHVGGSEYNVAAGLCSLGYSAMFVTKLPDNPLGMWAAMNIRASGVELGEDTFVKQGRLGIYFLEQGASPRPSKVVYDRAGSALSLVSASDFQWKKYLDGAGWFHVSGITPALGTELVRAASDAIATAKGLGIPVSFDLNYRANLWSTTEARIVLEPLMRGLKLLITTEEDLERVFGIDATNPERCAMSARTRFNADVVAVTLRETPTVLRNSWGGCACGPDGFRRSATYEVEIIDRVGAGDAFTAGFIAGMLEGDIPHALDMAAAFSAIKHSIPGDVCFATREEVEALIKSGGAGRIQR